jgi:hypothetical protein
MRLKPQVLLGFTIAFVGGFAGGDDATALLFVALGTFIPACSLGGTWWVWFVLSLSAWAGGSGVLSVLRLGTAAGLPDPAGQLDTLLTVAAALSSALIGRSLNWATSRLIRQR